MSKVFNVSVLARMLFVHSIDTDNHVVFRCKHCNGWRLQRNLNLGTSLIESPYFMVLLNKTSLLYELSV